MSLRNRLMGGPTREERAARNAAIGAIEAEGRFIGRVDQWPPDSATGRHTWWFCRTCGAGVLDRELHDRWHSAQAA